MEKKETRGGFTGSLGFVLAAAGSAVGLGNIWRFPYLAAKDGGGVFLLCYLILALTFGFALLTTEIAIGRKTAQSPLTAYGVIHKNWKWIGIQFAVFGAALAAYYLVWKIALYALQIPASSYLGIDKVGVMGVKRLIYAAIDIIRVFVRFFLEWNILQYGVTVYSVLNILFLGAFGLGLFQAVRTSGCGKNRVHLLLLLLCVASLPFGCYVWMLTSPDVTYRVIMLQSVSILYIFMAVIFDRWIYGQGKKRQGNAALVLLTAIVFNNSVAANMSYAYMEKCYEATYADAVELTTRVHLLDDGTIRYVALCGSLESWQQEDHFDPSRLRQLGAWKHMDKTILTPQFLALYTDFDLSYYRINGLEHPLVENEPNIPAPYDWEFRFPTLSAADTLALSQTEAVVNMPIWPARDSVQVFGDTIVVKLSHAEPRTAQP